MLVMPKITPDRIKKLRESFPLGNIDEFVFYIAQRISGMELEALRRAHQSCFVLEKFYNVLVFSPARENIDYDLRFVREQLEDFNCPICHEPCQYTGPSEGPIYGVYKCDRHLDSMGMVATFQGPAMIAKLDWYGRDIKMLEQFKKVIILMEEEALGVNTDGSDLWHSSGCKLEYEWSCSKQLPVFSLNQLLADQRWVLFHHQADIPEIRDKVFTGRCQNCGRPVMAYLDLCSKCTEPIGVIENLTLIDSRVEFEEKEEF